jgi:cysteine desulfuration protein SufE
MNTFEKKIETWNLFFEKLSTKKELYQALISLGRKLPPMSRPEEKNFENKVHGCQSEVFISSYMNNDNVFFVAESDALITSGLAFLLISIFSGESPKKILMEKPFFLEKWNIPHALSMNRSNGLYQMHKHIQKKALQCAQDRFKIS